MTGDTLVTYGSLKLRNELYPEFGTYSLKDMPGWFDQPTIDLDTENLPGQHGAFPPELPTYGPRVVRLEADISLPPGQDIRLASWPGFSGIGLSGKLLTVKDPFGTLFTNGWPTGAPKFTVGKVPWIGTIALDIFCPDPRKYRQQEPNGAFPAGAVTSSGLVYPLFDDGTLDFGAFSISGGFYLKNNGTVETWPIFRIVGEFATGFTIASGARLLVFNGAVPAGQELVLSPYAGGRAILNGVDRTDLLVQADWAPIGAGETVGYSLTANSTYTATAKLTADMKDAFI